MTGSNKKGEKINWCLKNIYIFVFTSIILSC